MSPVSPCVVWATEADLMENCDLTPIKPQTLDAAFVFASDVLYNLTRRRWPGECTDTFRPFCNGCCYAEVRPQLIDGRFYNLVCGPHEAIRLPASDVIAITQVKIDGVAVPTTEYGLRDGRYLYATRRADGSVRQWPCWQDLNVTASDPDSFLVSFTHGAEPPPSMVTACALLAWEFALAWTPDCEGTCRLPKRVTTVTRAGMTFAIVDPLTLFEKGLVGVSDIDVLIQAVNRGESSRRAFVGRPGTPSSVIRQP